MRSKFMGLLLAGAITLPVWFVDAVAARCSGEAAFAVPACACTVKNRLDAGWHPGKVLSAYYAADRKPTQESKEAVAKILGGETECNPDEYYLFSTADTRALRLQTSSAVASYCDDSNRSNRCVYTYARFDIRWK